MINCNKENMSYVLDGDTGGFVGTDVKDNKA
jgi:hypothetical protein